MSDQIFKIYYFQNKINSIRATKSYFCRLISYVSQIIFLIGQIAARMRKTLLVFFLVFSSALYANTYYVAPSGGSDMNPGTIDRPWATWQKAFNTAQAGDTVYFRGGVWYLQPGQTVDLINRDGAPGKYIHFCNYPGEKPVLDGSRIVPPKPSSGQYSYSGGPYIDGSNYIHWRGLTIRNFYQIYDRVFVQGIVATNSNFQIFENIDFHLLYFLNIELNLDELLPSH